ncbi:hypothetical protein FQN57_003663 [Myotisia sp. PD_48]|nr:hypothetical protein FQN57_003663 [Myotisia sp. PD_48]
MKATTFLAACLQSTLLTGALAAEYAFVGSYESAILTYTFNNQTGALQQINSIGARTPSWIEVSDDGKFLYAVEEVSGGGLASFKINPDGRLTKAGSAIGRPFGASLGFNKEKNVIITANYGDSSASVYSNDPKTGAIKSVRNFQWKITPKPGAPDNQRASHPHQALFDDSGKFALIPDLGADLIRILKVNGPNNIQELKSVEMDAKTGPRHGVFYPAKGTPKYYFVVAEIANTITAYSVSYPGGDIQLTKLRSYSTLEAGMTGAAGEILISPSGKHLFASNRLDNKWGDRTSSIARFALNGSTGELGPLSLINSGVENIRHMIIHPEGNYFVTQGFSSQNIKVFKFDSETGNFGALVDTEQARMPAVLQWLNTDKVGGPPAGCKNY